MTPRTGDAAAAVRPSHVVVMGVSGSGKTSVGRALAGGLGAQFVEGDDHHPPENVAKMAAGVPLTDADRVPWLDRLAAVIAGLDARGTATVVACSALRRPYRDRLRAAVPPGSMVFLMLEVDRATLLARMTGRDHFMPPALLDSQLATLEPLHVDEPGVVADARPALPDVIAYAEAAVRRWLRGPARGRTG